MHTVSDIKATFYDHQRQQANLFETLITEIVALNDKIKVLTPEPKEEKAK